MLQATKIREAALAAESRIRPFVRLTYLEPSPWLSHLGDASVLLKLENLQYTGSFKVRGAVNKLLSLDSDQRQSGCVAASTGNHGIAVAYGLQKLNLKGVIFVPEYISPAKASAIEALGGITERHGRDPAETELFAREYAQKHQMTYISPYNDMEVIGGQGTIALEIMNQIDALDAIFVSVGGGGLISGIAGCLKARWPDVAVIGCSPANSPVMAESLKEGHILELESLPTLSDGTAGGIEPEAITFRLCQELVDEVALVSEEEIASAMRMMLVKHHMLVEGSAGVAVGGYLQRLEQFRQKRVAVVICGANVDLETLRRIL